MEMYKVNKVKSELRENTLIMFMDTYLLIHRHTCVNMNLYRMFLKKKRGKF